MVRNHDHLPDSRASPVLGSSGLEDDMLQRCASLANIARDLEAGTASVPRCGQDAVEAGLPYPIASSGSRALAEHVQRDRFWGGR